LSGKSNETDFFYHFVSYTNPGGIYHMDLSKSREAKNVWSTKLPEGSPNPKDFVTDRIEYESKDGTKVPMFLIRKKSTLPDLSKRPKKPIPTLIYVYGGFGKA
jgi:prolyl oligopeptidase